MSSYRHKVSDQNFQVNKHYMNHESKLTKYKPHAHTKALFCACVLSLF